MVLHPDVTSAGSRSPRTRWLRSMPRQLTRALLAVSALAVLSLGATGVLVAQTDGGAPAEPVVEPVAVTPTPEQRIRVLLSGYDSFPTRDELVAIAPDATAILIAIYQSDDAKQTLKLRALDALGYFSDDAARAFFAYLLQNDGELESRHLHHAITAYAKAFGDQALEVEARFLKHADAQIRLTTVTALAQFGGLPSRQVLQRHLEIEKSPMVREKLEALR